MRRATATPNSQVPYRLAFFVLIRDATRAESELRLA
jgi:hypothetical protein